MIYPFSYKQYAPLEQKDHPHNEIAPKEPSVYKINYISRPGSGGASCDCPTIKLFAMANTFSQVYLQFVFAVKHRQNLIPKEHKEELHKYITGLVRNRNAKMLAIHCMPDHVHLFVGFRPTISIPDFIKEIKVESNQFINSKKWIKGKFSWQEGYGVFSYSHSHIDKVIKYILNQEKRHQKKTFKEEYLEFLEKFEIAFEEKYLFEFIE